MSDKIIPLNEKIDGYDPMTQLVVRNDVAKAVEGFKKDLRECDEFFNVKDYNDTHTTDKFIGIVDLFLRKRFGGFKVK